jgi:hypothetical protein
MVVQILDGATNDGATNTVIEWLPKPAQREHSWLGGKGRELAEEHAECLQTALPEPLIKPREFSALG